MKIYLTNSAGLFTGLKQFKVYGVIFTLEEAKDLLENTKFISAIGHESTAKFLSKLTNVEIDVNRISIDLKDMDSVLAFIITPRLPERVILDEEEMKNYEYKFLYYQIFEK